MAEARFLQELAKLPPPPKKSIQEMQRDIELRERLMELKNMPKPPKHFSIKQKQQKNFEEKVRTYKKWLIAKKGKEDQELYLRYQKYLEACDPTDWKCLENSFANLIKKVPVTIAERETILGPLILWWKAHPTPAGLSASDYQIKFINWVRRGVIQKGPVSNFFQWQKKEESFLSTWCMIMNALTNVLAIATLFIEKLWRAGKYRLLFHSDSLASLASFKKGIQTQCIRATRA